MPRKRQTQTGEQAQPIQAPPGAGNFGDVARLEEQQEDVPLPQKPGFEEVLAVAERATPPTPGRFARPSERPREPVQAGLPVGAGPGPEALGARPPLTEVFRTLALETNNIELAQLAEKAARFGPR